jgi:hypothetical protein
VAVQRPASPSPSPFPCARALPAQSRCTIRGAAQPRPGARAPPARSRCPQKRRKWGGARALPAQSRCTVRNHVGPGSEVAPRAHPLQAPAARDLCEPSSPPPRHRLARRCILYVQQVPGEQVAPGAHPLQALAARDLCVPSSPPPRHRLLAGSRGRPVPPSPFRRAARHRVVAPSSLGSCPAGLARHWGYPAPQWARARPQAEGAPPRRWLS